MAAPIVTEVNPKKGPDSGGNTVEIIGTNLESAESVTFGWDGGDHRRSTPTLIKVTAPAHVAAPVDVRVVTAGGESANTAADNYAYTAVPIVTAIKPTKGGIKGINEVEIIGINISAATKVEFGSR